MTFTLIIFFKKNNNKFHTRYITFFYFSLNNINLKLEDKEKFTSDQLAENDLAKNYLIDFIKSGDAILMVGAGSSGGIYPAWGQFIEKLEIEAKKVDSKFNANNKNFLEFADEVKKCLMDDLYYNTIYDTFQPKDPTHFPFHELLCKLPFKAITTTNYDMVMEAALHAVSGFSSSTLNFEGNTKRKIHDFLTSLNYSRKKNRMIVHLHGVYDHPESIVLGGKEYASKYGFGLQDNKETLLNQINQREITQEELSELLIKHGYEWPIRRKLLWALLATRRIVFFGFSMNDDYFNKMLEFVKDDISTYNSETHFLVLRVTAKSIKESLDRAKYLKSNYGITTVFFQDDEGKFDGLRIFIEDLADKILDSNIGNQKINPITEEEVLPKGDKIITDKLFELSKKQSSDED